MEAEPLHPDDAPTGILYNDIDPFCCEWLRRLMAADLIPRGDVWCRSITEIQPYELEPYHTFHAFAGLGGWAYALRLAGIEDDFPLWTFSCPCQPWSAGGLRRGHKDPRHLWPAYHGLAQKRRPPVMFGEQVVHAIRLGWLDGVARDLEGCGYAVGSAVLQASAVGARHKRDRLWILAHAQRHEQWREKPRCWPVGRVGWTEKPVAWDARWQDTLASFRAMDDGVPRCVAGTDAARNAIVPEIAAEFILASFEAMYDAIDERIPAPEPIP